MGTFYNSDASFTGGALILIILDRLLLPGANPADARIDFVNTASCTFVTTSVPCVLRLTRQSDNYTIELPWHPAYSPSNVRLRLIRGEQYHATLSRVPLGSGFTTDGFWWADLDFAVPPGIATLGLPPTTANGIMTRHLGTVCVRFPLRELPPWVVPGVADILAATLAAWKIEIAEPELFCHGATAGELLLTENSLYDGTIEWRGLPPVEVRTGNPLEFDPSAVPPGRYTVTASAALNPLVADDAEVDMVHIGVATGVVWLSTAQTNSYDIALSDDTYPTGGVYVWSEPEGISSQSFTPSDLTSGVYNVYLTHGFCGVAQMTVNVVKVDLDIRETIQPQNRAGRDDPRVLARVRNRILIWANSGANTITFDLIEPPDITSPVWIQIEDQTGLNAGMPNFERLDSASKTFTYIVADDNDDADLLVHYGADLNTDGTLFGTHEIKGTYEVYGVTAKDYSESRNNYNWFYLPGALYDLADQLHRRFANGVFGSGDFQPTTTSGSATISATRLTHYFGANLTDVGFVTLGGRQYYAATATLPIYHYADNSDASELIRQSSQLKNGLNAFVASLSHATVAAAYAGAPGGATRSVTFSLDGINFQFGATGSIGLGGVG